MPHPRGRRRPPPLLIPPGRDAPRPAAPTPAAAPEPAAPLRGPAGIEIENARPLDTESIGLIDAPNGGLASDAWSASNRTMAERLVRDLPAPIASTPVRALAIRTLASAAAAPAGGKGTNFAALRALKLRQLGDIAGAADLAGRIPQRTTDENLLRILIDEAWLSGADERACGHVREALAVSRHGDFQKALMFCQALAGDSNRAQLGLAMLRDQGIPEDPAFITLLLATGGDGKGVKLDSLRNASPMLLAMLRAAKVAPPADTALTSDPAVLASLAKGNLGSPEFRLAAGERAEAFGALAPDALRGALCRDRTHAQPARRRRRLCAPGRRAQGTRRLVQGRAGRDRAGRAPCRPAAPVAPRARARRLRDSGARQPRPARRGARRAPNIRPLRAMPRAPI